MTKYYELIKSESVILKQLHDDVHTTYSNKDKKGWHEACEKFHSYISPLDNFFILIDKERDLNDQDLLEFSITFLEIDPMFFRSGYIKEDMLTKLKRAELNKTHKERLLSILVNAAEKRGTREYRRYCRLAAFISTETLITNLQGIVRFGDSASKSRAKLMLQYIGT